MNTLNTIFNSKQEEEDFDSLNKFLVFLLDLEKSAGTDQIIPYIIDKIHQIYRAVDKFSYHFIIIRTTENVRKSLNKDIYSEIITYIEEINQVITSLETNKASGILYLKSDEEYIVQLTQYYLDNK